jgi:SH3-like domain-containing protein
VRGVTRAWRAGLLGGESWVTADELYGQNPAFRAWLVDHEIPFVLATRRGEPGAEVVDPLLPAAVMSAANWSETWQKLHQHGVDADRATRRHRLGSAAPRRSRPDRPTLR